MAAKSSANLDRPELYINRELSWLEFNRRVLEMGTRETLPLLERLKFLAIFSSNLDEFFMIRVAGLIRQVEAGVQKADHSGLTPGQQLDQIRQKISELVGLHTQAVKQLLEELRGQGMNLFPRNEWNIEQKQYLRNYFIHNLMPLLTPLAVEKLHVCPLLPSMQLHLGITMEPASEEDSRIMIVPVPTVLPRLVVLTFQEKTFVAPIEDILADNIDLICHNRVILSVDVFRITRDADISIQEDEASDLLQSIETAVLERKRRSTVRIEISGTSRFFQNWLKEQFEIEPLQMYTIDGLLDTRCFWEVAGLEGFGSLRWPDWPPQPPQDLEGFDTIWQAVSDRDVMLFHPYESFEPVVKLIQAAAEDPSVLAIKQTLYRTSPDSPIIDALETAAQKGKEVTVLVELKARFDEARNVKWARRLEDAGCYVLYGVAGLKTHAKALLIIRREAGRIKRYVHLATGNYNDKTAKMYSDIGIFTCDSGLATDVSSFFNLLTGFSEPVGWSKLTIAPTSLRHKLLDLIEREIKATSPAQPGMIMIKANSLEDKEICRALYEASVAGVQIQMNIRGICCLRPGVKGVSENIKVTSILDRYLEHARIYYFGNSGHPEIYLSSADMMRRNLDRRLELLFPVNAENLRQRLSDILQTFFSDTTNTWHLQPDGSYTPAKKSSKPVRAQQAFYEQSSGRAKRLEAEVSFRPIRSSEKS